MPRTSKKKPKLVETITHKKATRPNIPTAEHAPLKENEVERSVRLAYKRRNLDLDPQLVWRGKEGQGVDDLLVQTPPLHIQEKVHPKVLIDDLIRQTKEGRGEGSSTSGDLFADFNGLPSDAARAEFYRHEANWSNRMILGDSLQVMSSLGEREGLRGKVQCIYIDPPYGIRYNSNFQWSTTSRDVKDGKAEHITREPEQVKAFRDTWRDGIHSYLSYLRDRLTVAHELLAETGSLFLQIGDENSHRVRALMDEVFGEENFVREIFFAKTGSLSSNFVGRTGDRIIWYSKQKELCKFRPVYEFKNHDNFYKFKENDDLTYCELDEHDRIRHASQIDARIFRFVSLESAGPASIDTPLNYCGETYRPNSNRHWQLSYPNGMDRLLRSGRISRQGSKLRYRLYIDDYPVKLRDDVWTDTAGFASGQVYVVETRPKVVERCILMSTDPGDLVLDPTCGSGTTAYVAEQWGRRWITIDTSRVALALARARIMGARYPWYLLADSPEGQTKEAEVSRRAPSQMPTGGDIRQGFVYERVPHVTLKSISDNSEIDTIWETRQSAVDKALRELNAKLQGAARATSIQAHEVGVGGRAGVKVDFAEPDGRTVELPSGDIASTNALLEWEVPRRPGPDWPDAAGEALATFWETWIARQKEVDASIAANADQEFLFDKPYSDSSRIRVAGPFTVESVAPHRTLALDQKDELIPMHGDKPRGRDETPSFAGMILENLRTAGVQQAHKEDRIKFTELTPWPGRYVCATGQYVRGGGANTGRISRAGIFIGPEFGTVAVPDLAAASQEAAEAGFDVLIACAFNYDAHAAKVDQLGDIPVLKARMNADLHMAEDLKNTGKGNLFVIFGEPDIDICEADGDLIRVQINGVDVFHPNTGEVRSDDPDGIACWFIDTDYNDKSFFVRHAYFLGAKDPYKALKTTLKAEIDQEAWSTLHSDISRPFPKPSSGRIAVKVINHLGDEVMKVFEVGQPPPCPPQES